MNIIYLKAYMLALSVIPMAFTASPQGILIQSGGIIESVGSTSIQISDGNFANSGTFNSGTGTLFISGNSAQTITSSGCSFNNIVFDNQRAGNSDITIADPMVINGTATFTNGIVGYSGTGSLAFGNSAISTAGSAGSFVDGVVSKSGNTAFTFPVGDVKVGGAVWAPLAIAAPAVSSTIAAEYVYGTPAYNADIDYFCNPASFDFVSSNEYWNISTTGSTPEITLFWKDGTRSGIQNLSDLRVASWEDCTGNKWIDRGGATSGSTADGSITTTIPITSFSKVSFASQSGQNTLPVSLIGFSANCSNGAVLLQWTTASEINNYYFTLERSLDLEKWTNVAKVPGAGNSNSQLNYSFSDEQSSTGNTYYRLTQTDFNGESATFDPVMVLCDKSFIEVSCYPNPFTDQLIINVQNAETGTGEIRLIDVTGRTVMHKVLTTLELSQNNIELRIPDMALGVYSLEFRTGSYVKTMRVVKND